MSKRINCRVVVWPAYQRYIGGDSKRVADLRAALAALREAQS